MVFNIPLRNPEPNMTEADPCHLPRVRLSKAAHTTIWKNMLGLAALKLWGMGFRVNFQDLNAQLFLHCTFAFLLFNHIAVRQEKKHQIVEPLGDVLWQLDT